MSPEPSQDQSTEEIIDLTDIVEDDQVEEEYSAAEVAESSDRETQESLDEASLEEELSDFFSKLDEGGEDDPELESEPDASGQAPAAQASEEENFDLDDLFEDISEQESDAAGTGDTPLDQDPWEDIDLELPGAEPTVEDTVDEGDEFSELDDLFDDLEKDQKFEEEPRVEASEEEPVVEEPALSDGEPLEVVATEPLVELEEETWDAAETEEGLPGASSEEVDDLKARYRKGAVGDVEVKRKLARALNEFLDPVRERRAELASREGLVEEILLAGNATMREVARSTMERVREAMGLTYYRT
ncbi:MAG: hypothetical protein ACOC0J_02495 [Myxococcota bacterium]